MRLPGNWGIFWGQQHKITPLCCCCSSWNKANINTPKLWMYIIYLSARYPSPRFTWLPPLLFRCWTLWFLFPSCSLQISIYLRLNISTIVQSTILQTTPINWVILMLSPSCLFTTCTLSSVLWKKLRYLWHVTVRLWPRCWCL